MEAKESHARILIVDDEKTGIHPQHLPGLRQKTVPRVFFEGRLDGM